MAQQHPLELKGETMVPPPVSAQVMALLLLPLLLALPTRARPVPTPADESGELVVSLVAKPCLHGSEEGGGWGSSFPRTSSNPCAWGQCIQGCGSLIVLYPRPS